MKRFLIVVSFLGLLGANLALAWVNREMQQSIDQARATMEKQTEVIQEQKRTIAEWQNTAQICASVGYLTNDRQDVPER
jgi:hypothetical protein